MRDINRDEHVVYDYAMTETEGSLHAGLECRCGAGREGGKEGRGEEGMTCRGVLRFDDWRRASWAERYSGHVTSYVQRKMEENSWHDTRVVLRFKKGANGAGEGGMVEGGEGGGKEKGLFLTAAMRKGEVVLVFAGKVVGMEGLLAAGRRNMELSLQVRLGLLPFLPPSLLPSLPFFPRRSIACAIATCNPPQCYRHIHILPPSPDQRYPVADSVHQRPRDE